MYSTSRDTPCGPGPIPETTVVFISDCEGIIRFIYIEDTWSRRATCAMQILLADAAPRLAMSLSHKGLKQN